MKQAVILAGGKGTRLRSVLGDLPKPLIPIGSKPLLEHHFELCRAHGFERVLVLAGHRAGRIQAHCGDGSRWGLLIECEVEREPMGTAGAVLAAFSRLPERFLVLYGDEMLNVDLDRMWRAHLGAGAAATLLLHPNDHPLDSDLVDVDDHGWIRAFYHRPHPPEAMFQNLVNAALYVVERSALTPWADSNTTLDFGQDLFPAMLDRGNRLLGYRSPEYIKDIGTPDRYARVCREYEAGVVAASSLAVPQKGVFVDRDGTLNREVGGVCAPDRLELLPGVPAAIRDLNHRGWRVVVVTNQPVVAKGFCNEADVQRVHNKLETLLGAAHAFVDRIYWCPHHPERGFPGERPDLKLDCACRKPKPGLVLRAARDLNIDLRASWFVGDSTTDIATASNAGVRSILVRTGHAGQDGKFASRPDHMCETLAEAVQWIVSAGNAHRISSDTRGATREFKANTIQDSTSQPELSTFAVLYERTRRAKQDSSSLADSRMALESAEANTRGGGRPAPAHDESRSERLARIRGEEGRLRAWAERQRILVSDLPPADDLQGEHGVHYDLTSDKYIKFTRPDRHRGYGIALGSHLHGASPAEYLDRLSLQNTLFNDGVRLEAVSVRPGGRLSIITSQPRIVGEAATLDAIDALMSQKGYGKLADGAFLDSSNVLLVCDLFPRNVIGAHDGTVCPIDPVIQRITPDFARFLTQHPERIHDRP